MNLNYDKLLSSVAVKCNLRHCSMVGTGEHRLMIHGGAVQVQVDPGVCTVDPAPGFNA